MVQNGANGANGATNGANFRRLKFSHIKGLSLKRCNGANLYKEGQ